MKTKPRFNWIVVVSVIVAALIFLFALWFWDSLKEKNEDSREYNETWCSEMYDEIDADMQNANYCTNDTDCKKMRMGGMYIEFGCFHFVNRNENSSDFYARMTDYTFKCHRMINECSDVPEPACVGGKCVAKSGMN